MNKKEFIKSWCNDRNEIMMSNDLDNLISQAVEMEREIGKAITEQAVQDEREKMFLNMQSYMEYHQMEEYVTPQEWIEKHKHFNDRSK